MTNKQLHLLKMISRLDPNGDSTIDHRFEGLDEDTVEELENLEYIVVSIGEGFMGGVRTLSITHKGKRFIESFCDTCECMPCDCDWGH